MREDGAGPELRPGLPLPHLATSSASMRSEAAGAKRVGEGECGQELKPTSPLSLALPDGPF